MAKALSSCVSQTKSVTSSSATTTTTKTTLDFNVDLNKLDWKKLGPGADALRKLLVDRKDAGRLIAAAAGLAANSMVDGSCILAICSVFYSCRCGDDGRGRL
jgi:hypothetical protein